MFEAIDGVFKPWEEALKLPQGVTGRQWAPEAVAYLIEVPEDLLFDTLGAKIAKFLVGAILAVVPQFALPMVASGWSSRDTEDMQGIAKHLCAEGLDPTPEEMVKIANAIGKIRRGLTFGNWDMIAEAIGAKPLDTVLEELKAVGTSITSAFGIPTTPTKPEQPAPTPEPETTPTPPSYPPSTVESPGFG